MLLAGSVGLDALAVWPSVIAGLWVVVPHCWGYIFGDLAVTS
jgi:hypothetical protein